MSEFHLTDTLTDQALAALSEGAVVSAEIRARLEKSVEDLDEAYFNLQDEVGDVPGREAEISHLFRRARAMASLQFACAEDAADAVFDATYEGMHALGVHLGEVRKAVGFES